ncbi:hypothetical protein ACS0TY_009574 [Phlomoides rotata]
MGCFPACFGHWSHKQTKKDVQHQCLSPSNESAQLLSATMESPKEEDNLNPIKLVQESNNELTSSNNDERIEHKDDGPESSFSISVMDCVTKETTFVGEESCDSLLERAEHKDDGPELKFSSFSISDKDCVTKETTFVGEESPDSLFSLSIDSRKRVLAVDLEDKEVESSLEYDEDKENVGLSKDPIVKQLSDDHQLKKRESEIAADTTSLSSWLVASEKSSKKMSMESSPQSEKNYEEREILGAITSAAEFKEMNGILSGGDDQVGVGTVGGYWRRREAAAEPELLAEVVC